MLYRWRKGRSKARFNRLTSEILTTPPMPVVDGPCSIISMVSNDDVQMYLLALKSFYRHLKKGKIIAIIDRDMPSESRRLLERHVPGIAFVILEDIDTGSCQRGGTWERVLHLVDHSRNEYAIQLDSDTLTFGADIDEVLHCVKNNIAFTLGSNGRPIKNMIATLADVRDTDGDHVCIATERAFERYPGADRLNYVRASSGFVGLARGGIGREAVEEFHRNMEKLLGARWTEWGTEQCASNFAVANSPGAIVLPFPKYGNFSPRLKRGSNSFLHFIGTFRYDDDYFATEGRKVIAALKADKAAETGSSATARQRYA